MAKELVGGCRVTVPKHVLGHFCCIHLSIPPDCPVLNDRIHPQSALGSRCPRCQHVVHPIVFLDSREEELGGKGEGHTHDRPEQKDQYPGTRGTGFRYQLS